MDSSSYKLTGRIKNKSFTQDRINTFRYRPFDNRWIYYDASVISRPDFEVMRHFLENNNVGLVFSKFWDVAREWNTVMAVDGLVDRQHIVTHGTTYAAPLYIKKESEQQGKQNSLREKENIDRGIYAKTNFTEDFINFISNKYGFRATPEQILGYIYAMLYSPRYRKKYHDFLATDYPKVPFMDDEIKFKKLADLGQKLIDLHLLKSSKIYSTIAEFKEKGTDYIEKIRYDEKTKKLYINEIQYFDYIPDDIWHFEIGGTQVLYNWLSDRKGIVLSYEEQIRFKQIVYSLKETIEIMSEIDKVYT